MQNIVTIRFIECHDYLLQNTALRSSRQFALQINYQPQSLNEVLNGRRDIPMHILHKSISLFKFSPNYLFLGIGEPTDQYDQGRSQENNGQITYVTPSEQADYGDQITKENFINELQSFSLPGDQFKFGTFRCFNVDDDSMEPSLYSQDRIICNEVKLNGDTNAIHNNQIYVVVTNQEVLVKRLLVQNAFPMYVELHSDNVFYKSYTLHIEDIQELWAVNIKMGRLRSANVRNTPLTDDIKNMKTALSEQSILIKDLHITIDKLLKVSRSKYRN